MTRSLSILLAVCVATVPLFADAQPEPKKPAVTEADEAAAVEFARTHHAELAELLERLRTSDRPAYRKAVREIAGARERIAKLREADPERHTLVLRNWTLDSRIRLLAARRTMSDDAARRDELKALLLERRQGRLALLRLDRDRAAARLKKLDAQIDELERAGDDAIERDLVRIERAAKASARNRQSGGKKPAAVPPSKKTPSEADAP